MESQSIHIYSHVHEHEFSEEKLHARLHDIEKRNTPIDFDSVNDFNLRHGAGAPSKESISLLRNKNAFCVVTGQQIGVLGSPLLSLYKLISAEIYSKQLQDRLHHPVVPVFWLQTEDHDLEEISTIKILDQGLEPKSLTLSNEAYKNINEQKRSVGSLSFSENTHEMILSFLSLAGYTMPDDEFKKILKETINSNETLSTSFVKWMFSILPETKAIFIDPRLACFNTIKQGIFKDSFINSKEISSLLSEHTALLKKEGKETPVLIKQNSPLPFFHPEGKDAPRYRLQYHNKQYTYGPDKSVISEEEVLTHLERSPASFSSSALLRPIIQDCMLPSLAYIGGATELNYLEQAKPLYPLFGIKTPLWVPRAQSIILDQKNCSFLSSLSYDPHTLLREDLTTTQRKLRNLFLSSMENAETLQTKINPLLSEIEMILSEKPLDHDPTLEKPLQKTVEGFRGNIAKFLQKYNQSLLKSDEIFIKRLEKLLHIAFPNGEPQERVLSSVWLLVRYTKTSIEALYTSIENAYQVHNRNSTN